MKENPKFKSLFENKFRKIRIIENFKKKLISKSRNMSEFQGSLKKSINRWEVQKLGIQKILNLIIFFLYFQEPALAEKLGGPTAVHQTCTTVKTDIGLAMLTGRRFY